MDLSAAIHWTREMETERTRKWGHPSSSIVAYRQQCFAFKDVCHPVRKLQPKYPGDLAEFLTVSTLRAWRACLEVSCQQLMF